MPKVTSMGRPDRSGGGATKRRPPHRVPARRDDEKQETTPVKKIIRVATLGASLALVLAACGSAPEETEPTAGAGDGAAATDFKACVVSDAGGFDDKSFNQLSYEGTKEATEELGAGFAEVQSDSEADFSTNLESLVSENCNAIVSFGFALSAATVV